jgi:hypothetical protein
MKKLIHLMMIILSLVLIFNTQGCNGKKNPIAPSQPSAPSNLIATAGSSSQVSLTWNDNSNNEDGFKVERTPGGTTNFAQIASLSANTTSYQNTGLTASTGYSYRIMAYNSAGNSGYSNTATATTPSGVTVPAGPSNLTATAASSSQINLSWNDNSNNEDGFKVERAPGGTTNFAQIASLSANTTSYQNTGLSASTGYSYRVMAYNNAGNSGYSNTATVTTQSGATVPAGPSNLTATAISLSQINLSWNDNSNNEDGFKLERAPGSTTNFALIASLSANTTSYQNTGLSASTSYSYRILAYNSAGNSGYSNTVTAMTNAIQRPAPGISAPSTSTGTFTVSVTYSAWPTLASNFDGYELEESTTSSSSGFTKIQSSPGGTHTSPYNFTVTRNAGTYYYRARIYDGVGPSPGYSPYSSVATVVVTQPKAILRIMNNTHYLMIDIQLNGVQQIGLRSGLDVRRSTDFEFNSSGTVNYRLGVGFWDNNIRDVWFILTGSIQVTTGSTTTVTFNNPTIAQLLTNFQSSRNWDGIYYDSNAGPHLARYTFYSNGSWRLYDDGVQIDNGNVTLVSWPDYAAIVTFKVCGTCANIQLAYPFGRFLYRNGPPSWPIIEYIGQ